MRVGIVAKCQALAVLLCLILTYQTVFSANSNEWIINKAIPNLPRFNLKGQLVSSDLSEYIKFKCNGVGKSRSCEIDQKNMELSSVEELYQPSSDDNIQSYGTGVFLYAAIAFLAAILIIFGTCLHLCSISCMAMIRSCCLRKEDYKESNLTPVQRQVGAGCVTVTFFTILGVIIITAYTIGIKVAFSGMTDVVDSPYGVAQITYRLSLATQPVMVGTVSQVALPTLRNLNSTFCSAISWDGVIDDLSSLNSSLQRLPDINDVITSVENINASTVELNGYLTDILNFYDEYDEKLETISNSTDIVLGELRTLNDALGVLQNVTDAADATISSFNGYMDDLFGADGPDSYTADDRDGYIDSVQYDINHMTRSDTPGEGIPTSSTLNSAATGNLASLSRLLGGNLNSNSAELAGLIDKLTGIYESVIQMPNFAHTANQLQAIDGIIQNITAPGGDIHLLAETLELVEEQLNAMPNITLIRTQVDIMFETVDSLNGTSLKQLLRNTDAGLGAITFELNYIIDKIGSVSDVIRSVRSPIYDLLLVQPRNFNRTVYETSDTTEAFNSINKTLTSTARTIDETMPKLDDLVTTLSDSVDFNDFIDQINLGEQELADIESDIDRQALYNALDAAEIQTSFDVTSYTSSLDVLNATLYDAFVTDSVISAFLALEDLRYALETQLRDAVGQDGDVSSHGDVFTGTGEYRLLVQGVCSDQLDTYCTTPADCTSGTCDHIGAYRCAADGSAFSACTDDSDCTNDHCLADFNRAFNLQASLTALAQPDANDFGQNEVSDSFNSVRSASSDINLEQLQTQMDDITSEINDADVSQYEAQVLDIQDQIDSASSDYADYLDPVHDAQAQIDDFDFTDITDDLDGVQEKIDKYADQLEDYIDFARDLQDYVYKTKGMRKRLNEFEKPKLESTLNDEGFGPLLMSIGRTIERAADDVTEIMANNSLKGKNIEVTNSLRTPATYLDRFTANPHRGYKNPYEVGALYYMMQLTNQTAERMVNANDPMQKMILTDVNGDSYPDGKVCVTRTCFQGQQDDFENGYGAYLPLILAPLAIVALIALCNFGCLFVPAKSGGCCRQCMPHWMLCMIIVIIPWYLIFSGFIFTFFIAMSDSCTAGPKIASNYVAAYGDSLCEVLGGNGTLRECYFRGNDLDVSMDLKSMTDVVLGLEECSTIESEDPFYVPLHQFAEQIRNSSQERTIREVNKKAYDKFRQPLKRIALDFSNGTSLVLRNFVNSIGSEVTTCDNMQDIIEYMTSPVCYSVIGPWSWILATIYLAAWSMCCLGIPAGCMLRDSFSRDLLVIKHEEAEKAKKKNILLKYRFLALRHRGPLAGRNVALSPSQELHFAELSMGTNEHDDGENGGSDHTFKISVGDGGDGLPAEIITERVGTVNNDLLPSGGYIAYYPKIASSSYSFKEAEGTKEEVTENKRLSGKADEEQGHPEEGTQSAQQGDRTVGNFDVGEGERLV